MSNLKLIFIIFISFCFVNCDVLCNRKQQKAVNIFCKSFGEMGCFRRGKGVECRNVTENHKCRPNGYYACRDFMKTNPYIKGLQCNNGAPQCRQAD